jgi:hypothetical protein
VVGSAFISFEASETVRNSTVRNRRRVAEVAGQISAGADLHALEPAADEQLDLRLDAAARRRDAGILGGGA